MVHVAGCVAPVGKPCPAGHVEDAPEGFARDAEDDVAAGDAAQLAQGGVRVRDVFEDLKAGDEVSAVFHGVKFLDPTLTAKRHRFGIEDNAGSVGSARVEALMPPTHDPGALAAADIVNVMDPLDVLGRGHRDEFGDASVKAAHDHPDDEFP